MALGATGTAPRVMASNMATDRLSQMEVVITAAARARFSRYSFLVGLGTNFSPVDWPMEDSCCSLGSALTLLPATGHTGARLRILGR